MKDLSLRLGAVSFVVVFYLFSILGANAAPYNGFLTQQGTQLSSNAVPEYASDAKTTPEEFNAMPDYGDYLRILTKRRMSKISCLKSCVGQNILHPMQCHSLC